MRNHTLDQTILELARCLRAARQLRAARKAAGGKRTPVEAGALRRTTMDLTRKLADLRQGR
ncbi:MULTISPECIES: hypothetical protein [unclassified Pseudomonas]|uniref:hypothetical protein n=1 Tax=unclassified Pseudomonas TaxID=196821 RepID=UPI0024486C0C|nr:MULTISPECIES: hypothetical protein [unclassified Pseudomonas]MDG9928297.1 hypothetical protein [Pseudomonas sp. GD04042]MDH0481139.1 hypothetical protein [Pseudomonas sp. GD04015]MDH0604475.1 hypothetical protein [Pseudomonas sp. GD03869]